MSFGACLLAFTLVGVMASRYATAETSDYLLAGRSVSPWLTALSSVATNNSGFMFIGLIGYAYSSGVEAIWLQVSWIFGDAIAWFFIHGRTRLLSDKVDALSVPAFLGTARGGRVERLTIVCAGILTFFFLGGYAAAQLKAGSTSLEVLFGWHPTVGAIIGAVIVVIYCFSGGIRASIWTDAAQSFVMLFAMAMLVIYAFVNVGGPHALYDNLHTQDPGLVKWIPDLRFGIVPYVMGFMAGGLAAVGQPHIMIRTMALRDAKQIRQTRRFYFAWFYPFSAFALGVGLYARAIMPDLTERLASTGTQLTAEHALPALSMELLPPVAVGLMLAAIFAATMSTADSQILSCSAALTQDIAPRYRTSYWAAKAGTLGVTALALAIALTANEGVFSLVLLAWGILGSTLGPLMLLRAFGRVPSGWLSVAMMLVGIATVVGWERAGLSGAVYKVLPGMLLPLGLYGLVAAFSKQAAGRADPA